MHLDWGGIHLDRIFPPAPSLELLRRYARRLNRRGVSCHSQPQPALPGPIGAGNQVGHDSVFVYVSRVPHCWMPAVQLSNVSYALEGGCDARG